MVADVAMRSAARAVMDGHWREPGYTCPNADRYPWSWLWDSCFHAVVWAELGRPDRALTELATALAYADEANGFVPHMTYHGAAGDDAFAAASFWHRSSHGLDPHDRVRLPVVSSITQPPMFGHAVAELTRRGIVVPDATVEAAAAGVRFLLERRRRSAGGLVELVHPWESGCDDSPRWDGVLAEPWSPEIWRRTKGDLLDSVERSSSGAPLANPDFAVGGVGFTALVAWNALELATVTFDRPMIDAARLLVSALERRFDEQHRTWVDDGPTSSSSGSTRTLDSLLPLLVTGSDAVFDQLIDPAAFGALFGPRGVHIAESTYDRSRYWRGPAWPQLSYLLWFAAVQRGRFDVAESIAGTTAAAVARNGFAEHWDGETGEGGGAVPQSWSALVTCMEESGLAA